MNGDLNKNNVLSFEEISNIKSNANIYRKSKKYSDAIELYKELIESGFGTQWEYWGWSYCLNSLKKYDESLEVSFQGMSLYPEFDMLANVRAWALYYKYVSSNLTEENLFEKGCEEIISILKDRDKKYSPFFTTVFKVIEYYRKKTIYNAQKIEKFLSVINPDELSCSGRSFLNNQNIKIDIPSDKEKFYMYKSELLMFDGMYEETIELLTPSFQEIKSFHYNNYTWFKRKIAHSYFKLGKCEKALDIYLNEIINVKREWFVQKEIADIYLVQKEIDLAFKYAVDAVLNNKLYEKKLKLYMTLYNILMKMNKQFDAFKHIQLINYYRKINGWKTDNEVYNIMVKYNISNDEPNINQMIELWRKYKQSFTELIKGKIHILFPHGKSGFIKSAEDDFYFNVSSILNRHSVNNTLLNAEVLFEKVESFDKKKNKKSFAASNIRII